MVSHFRSQGCNEAPITSPERFERRAHTFQASDATDRKWEDWGHDRHLYQHAQRHRI